MDWRTWSTCDYYRSHGGVDVHLVQKDCMLRVSLLVKWVPEDQEVLGFVHILTVFIWWSMIDKWTVYYSVLVGSAVIYLPRGVGSVHHFTQCYWNQVVFQNEMLLNRLFLYIIKKIIIKTCNNRLWQKFYFPVCQNDGQRESRTQPLVLSEISKSLLHLSVLTPGILVEAFQVRTLK